MIAVHLEAGNVEIRQRPLPKLRDGFARIRLLAAGICSTDLELQRGYYGFSGTPSHEFVGEVIAVNSEDAAKWIGQRVVGEINLACGSCEWCARGLGRHCPRRTVLGIVKHPGSFAEFLTLPVANLRRVPAAIPTDHAVFVEPVAAACEILDQIRIPKGQRIAVLGDGKLGLLVAQVLHAHGAEIHLYGRHRDKLRIAEKAGATTEIISRKKTGTLLPQSAWPIVVDCTGSSGGLGTAIAICEPRGTVVMKSTVHGLVPIDTARAIVNEITLVGSRCGRFEPALRLLATEKVEVANLISESFPLDQAATAFKHAASPGVMKVLLRPPA